MLSSSATAAVGDVHRMAARPTEWANLMKDRTMLCIFSFFLLRLTCRRRVAPAAFPESADLDTAVAASNVQEDVRRGDGSMNGGRTRVHPRLLTSSLHLKGNRPHVSGVIHTARWPQAALLRVDFKAKGEHR